MKKESDESWLKAAVIGSIWASFEIIFGTFLHNLRIPFAGTFLTFFSLILLIGFSYKWNDRFLFLKAGIICALMRSMMPTSIILGPLIGILTEAVIFQVALRLFGRNFISFVFAGILSMFGALIHKIISILLIYGFDIVELLKNMYFVLLKTTHINLPVQQLLIIVSILYVILGFATALIGVRLGKDIINTQHSIDSIDINFDKEKEYKLFNTNTFYYNSFLILFHLITLVVSLVILEKYPFLYTLILIVPFLTFLVYRYGNSLRRLSKPIFWIQLVIVLAISLIFWSDAIEGLAVGMKMISRAILVVSVFTAISVELKNPVVKALMYQKGFSGLYSTIGLASSAVPFLLENIVISKSTFVNPVKVLKKAINLSDSLLKNFTDHIKFKNKITIISGETRSGKTTYLKNLINKFKSEKKDVKIGGILAHGIDENGNRLGFEIEDISNGNKFLLSNSTKEEGDIKVGKYFFKRNSIDLGKEILNKAIQDSDLLIIDEIGHFELKGKGWFDEIENAMLNPNLDMIWVVRKSLLEKVLKLWQHSNIEVIDVIKKNRK